MKLRNGFNHLCCMSSACRDSSCEGAQIARLHEAEGGHSVDGRTVFPLKEDCAEQMPQKFRLSPRDNQLLKHLMLARFGLIVLVAVLAVAAQVFA